MPYQTPILLITWRRESEALRLIHGLRRLKPEHLYIASDGGRDCQEALKVDLVRKRLLKEINWSCNVKTRFSDANQGCERGPSNAISWFFDSVDEGIILEDDCIPHDSFYGYCQDLLNHFRHDMRVWSISGNNFQDNIKRGRHQFYFSKYHHGWGWASWASRWKYYSQHTILWNELRNSPSLQKTIFDSPLEQAYWMDIWNRLFSTGVPQAWDYRWLLVSMLHHGLTILPQQNLVINTGFGEDATNTKSRVIQSSLPAYFRLSSDFPSYVCRDYDADAYTFNNHYGGLTMRFFDNIAGHLRLWLALRLRRIRSFLRFECFARGSSK